MSEFTEVPHSDCLEKAHECSQKFLVKMQEKKTTPSIGENYLLELKEIVQELKEVVKSLKSR